MHFHLVLKIELIFNLSIKYQIYILKCKKKNINLAAQTAFDNNFNLDYKQFLINSVNPIFVLNRDRKIIFFNKSAGRHFYKIEKNKNYTNLIHSPEQIAEKSNQLKTEFLAQMSHEIRSPINVILSFTSLLKEEFADKMNNFLEDSFASIDIGGRRIIRTIDIILNMPELQTGTFETILIITFFLL